MNNEEIKPMIFTLTDDYYHDCERHIGIVGVYNTREEAVTAMNKRIEDDIIKLGVRYDNVEKSQFGFHGYNEYDNNFTQMTITANVIGKEDYKEISNE